MAKVILLAMFALCLLPAIATAKFASKPFKVTGCVYCDTCRCGFETDATHYIAGAQVKIECRGKQSNSVYYPQSGKTGPNGCYEMIVATDQGDATCDVVLVKSSDPECSEPNKGRDRARVILTRNNGIVSSERHVNNLGFYKKNKLPNCPQVLYKYQLTPELWRI